MLESPRSLASRFKGFERVAAITATLVGTQAVTSILGFGYWVLAARTFSVEAVGVAAAATTAMQLLGSFGMLGLGTLLIREMSRVALSRRRLLVRTALALATSVSFVFGLVLAGVAQVLPDEDLAPIGSTPAIALLFAVGVALTGLTLVLDQAVLALGTGLLQLERNVIASATKIGFLVLLWAGGAEGGMAIYLSWTLGNLVSLPLVIWRTRGGLQHQESRRLVNPAALRGLYRAAASHHALNLALMAPPLLLSIVVVVVLSQTANGYFSQVRLVAGFVFVLPYAIAVGLFAAADANERELVRRMRLTLPLGIVASLAADVVLWPIARPILQAFGQEYADNGVTELRIIVLAGLPLVIKDHYVALRRVQGRTSEAALVVFLGGIVEVAAASVGAVYDGTRGVCIAWVTVLCVQAVLLAAPLRRAMVGVGAGGPGEAEDPASDARSARVSEVIPPAGHPDQHPLRREDVRAESPTSSQVVPSSLPVTHSDLALAPMPLAGVEERGPQAVEPTDPTAWSGRRRSRLLRHALVIVLLALTALAVASAGAHELSSAPASTTEARLVLDAYTATGDEPALAAQVDEGAPGRLGALQVGAWLRATDALERHGSAVGAAREVAVAAHLLALALLWPLARRLGLSPAAAAGAVVLAAIAPAGVSAMRTLSLESVATPWALAALLLALRGRTVVRVVAAPLMGLVAALTAPVMLLVLPVVVWLVARPQVTHEEAPGVLEGGKALRSRDEVPAVLAAGLTLLAVASYVLVAAWRRLWPSDDEGLLSGLGEALDLGRAAWAAGAPGRTARSALLDVLQADPVLLAATAVAAVLALWKPLLRPLGALLLLVAVAALSGLVDPAGVLPVAATLGGMLAVAVLALQFEQTSIGIRHRMSAQALPVAAVVAAVVAATLLWPDDLRRASSPSDAERTQVAVSRASLSWLGADLPGGTSVVVPEAMAVDVLRSPLSPSRVLPYPHGDTTSDWRDFQVLVSDRFLREATGAPGSGPEPWGTALRSSTGLAAFGAGEAAIDVRLVQPGGAGAALLRQQADREGRAQAGAQLLQGTTLELDEESAALVRGGRVDGRLLSLLALLASEDPIEVTLTTPGAEETRAASARSAVVTGIAGASVSGATASLERLRELIDAQDDQLLPDLVERLDDGLRLSYRAPETLGLFSDAPPSSSETRGSPSSPGVPDLEDS